MKNEEFKIILETKLHQKEKEFEELREEVFKKNEYLKILLGEIEGFKATLAATNRELGVVEPNSTQNTIPSSAESNEVNKTQFIVETIRKSGNRGVSAKEIKTSLEEAGITVPDNYLYVVVSKLKKQGKIKNISGRYSISEE
jgi:hypothetical protein